MMIVLAILALLAAIALLFAFGAFGVAAIGLASSRVMVWALDKLSEIRNG